METWDLLSVAKNGDKHPVKVGELYVPESVLVPHYVAMTLARSDERYSFFAQRRISESVELDATVPAVAAANSGLMQLLSESRDYIRDSVFNRSEKGEELLQKLDAVLAQQHQTA